MICYEFKGGTGTAWRVHDKQEGGYTDGVFVQANCGRRELLTIAGVPVGKEIPGSVYPRDTGSIIIVVATDAPLLPNQLKRLARRASMGLARTGSISGNGSGDLFLAFSTANPRASSPAAGTTATVRALSNDAMDPLFEATVQATEEAIVNSMVAARTMTGADGITVLGLPLDVVRDAFAPKPH